MTSPLELNPGEVPEYAFCEAVTAGVSSPWHIRKVVSVPKYSGGIDSSSLCGHVTPDLGGWDVKVRISEHHLGHSCKECVRLYRIMVPE